MASMDLTKPLFVAGTIASAWLSGFMMSISLTGTPAFLASSPAHSTTPRTTLTSLSTQMSVMYGNGVKFAPTTGILAGALHLGSAYLAFTKLHPSVGTSRGWLFVAAGLSSVGVIPYTLFVMAPTNARILGGEERRAARRAAQIADKQEEEDDTEIVKELEETRMLTKRWELMNGIRALLPLIGAVLAFEAL